MFKGWTPETDREIEIHMRRRLPRRSLAVLFSSTYHTTEIKEARKASTLFLKL